MTSALLDFFGHLFGLLWLAGPIFDKELRVSSRRKRNYFLRFAYVALLTAFVTFAWLVTARLGGPTSPVFQVSRMPEVGKHIVTAIVWFQFIAVQFIAVVMLSTAINDEIHRKTLGVLMTTPISSFQIVIGKLLSKLLQLVLLLAVSMPLLAIIRVLGGVPWDFVISSLCVTLTAAIFSGSLSLAFSIYNRQAHSVIVRTALVCFLLYTVPSIVVQLVQFTYQVSIVPNAVLCYINPFIVMAFVTEHMLSPSSAVLTLSWPLHCVIMAGVSALLLAFSTVCVRRAGRRQATGQAGMFCSRRERRIANGKRRARADSAAISRRVRRVKGPPIIWREMINLLIKISRPRAIISTVLAVFVLAAAYGYCAYAEYLASKEAQTGFILVYFFFGLFRVATSAATCITSEKEARTWPLLLTAPLAEKHIVFSKIISCCLQGWAFWLLLAAHLVVFSLTRYIPPAAIFPLALLVASSAILVSAVGVFLSSCFKRSSTAASINLILFLCFAVPICCPSPLPTFLVSPLFAGVMILTVTGNWGGIATPFPQAGSELGARLGAFLISGLALVVLVGIYLSLALAAFAITTSNIRRRVF
jgi:ABC-type transport system involved in multi-copper enzyme maturation permease subunit